MNAPSQRRNTNDDDALFIRYTAKPLIGGSQNDNSISSSFQGEGQIFACRRSTAAQGRVFIVDEQIGCHETEVRSSGFGARQSRFELFILKQAVKRARRLCLRAS